MRGASPRAGQSAALVVGFSIHGLAVARALARRGILVHCLAGSEAPPSPTTATRFANVHFRETLNSGPLVDYLLEVSREIDSNEKAVLFPTSDRIVRAVAEGWDRLEPRFLLAWSHCRDRVLQLQRKDALAHVCDAAGIRYPRSVVLHSPANADQSVTGLRFPLIAKPAQPLSSFKAIKLQSVADLRELAERFQSDLPFVIQEWVEGDEGSLFACTTYLDNGRPMFLFPSRKLAASPPGLGQGTVFESVDNVEICTISDRLLRTLNLSGPVAVEFKRDPEGQYWFIEPNVGRTEYCVDLAIQCGWDLPWIEYLHATGRLNEFRAPTRVTHCVWYDTDKDPSCFLRHAGALFAEGQGPRRPIFPFLGHGDWRPALLSALRRGQRLGRGLERRITSTGPA